VNGSMINTISHEAQSLEIIITASSCLPEQE
jgi:hypothetical protein